MERPSRRIKAPAPTRASDAPSHPQTVNSLLLAEDIRPISTVSATPSQPSAPATAHIPPKLAQADRAKLDAIAAPAIQHPRLPTARLCEIAITLCQHACLKPAELAELLNRKLVPIRDRVMPKIKEHPNVHCVDNIYYYIDK
jgi:hypothetical protein